MQRPSVHDLDNKSAEKNYPDKCDGRQIPRIRDPDVGKIKAEQEEEEG